MHMSRTCRRASPTVSCKSPRAGPYGLALDLGPMLCRLRLDSLYLNFRQPATVAVRAGGQGVDRLLYRERQSRQAMRHQGLPRRQFGRATQYAAWTKSAVAKLTKT